ncbi:MAG: hypothetical protein Q8P20_07930 [bacterium]|nr:hypothetical protein [bacterium]
MIVGTGIYIYRDLIGSKTIKIKPNSSLIINNLSEFTGTSEIGRHYKTSKPNPYGRVKLEYLGVGLDRGKHCKVYLPKNCIINNPTNDPSAELPKIELIPTKEHMLNDSLKKDSNMLNRVSEIQRMKLTEDNAIKSIERVEEFLDRYSTVAFKQNEIDEFKALQKASLDDEQKKKPF